MRQDSLKAIIFDYGNVLSLPPLDEHMAEMATTLSMKVPEFTEVYYQYRQPYDSGDLNPHEYWMSVAKNAGRTLSGDQIKSLTALDYKMWTRPNQLTIKWVDHLRSLGFQTAVLSNMPSDHREYIDANCPWFPRFDHRTFSGDLGFAKPGTEIYHHCLAGLKLSPSETLFLDDRIDNIQAAEKLGLNTILFTDAENAKSRMEAEFSIKLPAMV